VGAVLKGPTPRLSNRALVLTPPIAAPPQTAISLEDVLLPQAYDRDEAEFTIGRALVDGESRGLVKLCVRLISVIAYASSRIVRRIAADLIAWYCLPCAFLVAYVIVLHQPGPRDGAHRRNDATFCSPVHFAAFISRFISHARLRLAVSSLTLALFVAQCSLITCS